MAVKQSLGDSTFLLRTLEKIYNDKETKRSQHAKLRKACEDALSKWLILSVFWGGGEWIVAYVLYRTCIWERNGYFYWEGGREEGGREGREVKRVNKLRRHAEIFQTSIKLFLIIFFCNHYCVINILIVSLQTQNCPLILSSIIITKWPYATMLTNGDIINWAYYIKTRRFIIIKV